MNDRKVSPLKWLGLAVCAGGLLAGCGGDDSTPTLDGKVTIASASGWRVCIDANDNLQCDAGEVSTSTDAQGNYSVAVSKLPDEKTRLLAISVLAAGADASSAVTLAAPGTSKQISMLSTLVAATMIGQQDLTLADAQAQVRQRLSLPSTFDLLSPPSDWAPGYGVALQDAWTLGMQLRTANLLTANVDIATPMPDVPNTAPSRIAEVVLSVLSHYIDTSTSQLLATVTSRTITNEISERLQPTSCDVEVNTPVKLQIDTTDAAPIVSKEDYLTARFQLDADGSNAAMDVTTSIRGRGNTTWSLPKKPYRIKLAKSAGLLGMNSDKDWDLLANYSDKTLLRNSIAFCMSRMMHMAWTPDSRMVELWLNGSYQGVYQLTEHVEDGSAKADIGTTGVLLEIDARLDADYVFTSSLKSVPYTFQSDPINDQLNTVPAYIGSFESALFSSSFTDPTLGYRPFLDTESLVDFYLVQELLRNNDAFWSSTFLTRKDDGPLVFGPLWDFDIAAGNVNYNGNDATDGWWVKTASPYLQQLFQDPVFAAHVAARWKFLSSRMPRIQQFIDRSATTLDAAQRRNFQTWDILNTAVWPNPEVAGSYSGEISYMKNWLDTRATWIDQALGNTSTSATTP